MGNEQQISEQLIISPAPHISSSESVTKVMWTVVIALMPAAVFAVYLYGIAALVLMTVAVVAAVAGEAGMQLLLKKKVTALDGSAAITGLLLAMNLPPRAPWWMALIGSLFAIIIAKHLFGGLGYNIFNPALAGRAFLMASWPAHMTIDWHRFGPTNILAKAVENTAGLPPTLFDTITQATPLGLIKEGPRLMQGSGVSISGLYDIALSPSMIKSLAIGTVGGCIGETSALLLLAGGLILLIRKVITWHIPVSFIGSCAAVVAIYYAASGFPSVGMMTLYHVLAGGLFLGAFFMATDMVTSPVTGKGMLIFGAGCGLITALIRLWGGFPEGVSYSILIMNALVPFIDRFTKPRVFGTGTKPKKGNG